MNKIIGVAVAVIVVVAIAGGIYWYMNNKTISPTTTTSQQSNSNNNNNNIVTNQTSEKEQIISAFLGEQAIFASKDPAQIRAYMLLVTPDPTEKERIQKMTDKAILLVASLQGTASLNVTAEQLRDPSTIFDIKGDTADVTYKITGGTATYTATKVNGVWY